MKTTITLILLFLTIAIHAQVNNLTEKYTMDALVEETSGLIFYNGKLITHNDSGGTAQLFEMDSISNTITRTVTISNASNIDWEDITQDDDYIYIGDFGNNNGNRTDLKVYRVAKTDYTTNTTVTADTIDFSYADQTDFTTNSDTNFDAEAMIVKDNTILIFTKNHGDLKTNIYTFPKTIGTQSAVKIGTYEVNGLITGATLNATTEELLLTGYSDTLVPFIIQVADINNPTVVKTNILSQGSQVEAIANLGNNRYFISREHFVYGSYDYPQKLYAFNRNNTAGINTVSNNSINVFPNPSNGIFTIQMDTVNSGEYTVFNQLGQVVEKNSFATNRFQVSLAKKGLYFLEIKNNNITYKTTKLIIK